MINFDQTYVGRFVFSDLFSINLGFRNVNLLSVLKNSVGTFSKCRLIEDHQVLMFLYS